MIADVIATPAIILEANRRAELVYGYTAAEFAGMPAAYLIPEEARAAVLAIVQRVRQGQSVTAETTNQRRDCTCFPVRIVAAPDPTDARHMIVTVEDITAERSAGARRRPSTPSAIALPTRSTTAWRKPWPGCASSRRCGSHLADAAPPRMRAALDELAGRARCPSLTSAAPSFALRPVDLEALGFYPTLTQLVSDFGDQNQLAARLEITGPQEALPEVAELPLYRIIQEGLSNVGQHARANSVVVKLTVDPAGGVVVSVRDDGGGFDPSQLGPVDQAGHFGLRQMRERIVDLGGTLDIRSAIGQGTELLITLPPVASEISHAQNKGRTMSPIRLLLADDHTLVRQGLRQLCEGLGGFNVVAEAEDGAEAVMLARTAQPDVILMDIVMPEMDGVEAIRQIMRDDSRRPHHRPDHVSRGAVHA